MFRYRLIYAVTLVITIIFFTVYNPWFSYYLLLFMLALIPLDLLLSLPGMLGMSVSITVPAFLEKDSKGSVTLTVTHRKPYPIKCIRVKLRICGDDFTEQFYVIAPAEAKIKTEFAIDTTKTGLTVYLLDKLNMVSLLGLFSVRVKSAGRQSVLILPPAQKPKNAVSLPRGIMLRPKPGGGVSEEHDMREYRPGDPIRNIHWKLSAKLNSLIIREPLVPLPQSRLVHVVPWNNVSDRDRILSYLRWISEFLLSKEIDYYIRFGDSLYTENIFSEADLINYLRHVLDNTNADNTSVISQITRFSQIYTVSAEL